MKSRLLRMLTLAALALVLSPVQAEEGDEGDARFEVKGEVRFRGEFVSNYADFSDGAVAPADDDDFDFFPYRARLGFWGGFSENVSGYVEFQTGDAAGLDSAQRDVITTTADNLDLYMGFLKLDSVGGSNLDLTIGRQELVFDRELLLGDLDFYNGISHDGVRARWNLKSGPLDAFWIRLNETFTADADTDLLGVHFSWTNVIEGGDIGVYSYYLRDDGGLNMPPTSGVDRVDLLIVGGRAGRDIRGKDGFLWNAEAAVQSGTRNDSATLAACADQCDIMAAVFEGMFGYNWNAGDNDHRAFLNVYSATGDDDATDDELHSFNPLFQDFHARLGVADIVAGSNVQALSVGYKYLMKRQSVGVEIFQFLILEAETDAVLVGDPSGVPGRFGNVIANGIDEDDLGQEIDVVYDFSYNKYLSFGAALGSFSPGDAVLLALGSDDPALRLYGQARLRF